MDITLDYKKSEALMYWNMLKNLGKDVKVELISMLASSLAEPDNNDNPHDKKWASEFYGTWNDNRDADDIVADIRNSRCFSRNRDYLDLL